MRIIHFCLPGEYTDYWTYHDNMLPKAHKQLGHDVTMITTPYYRDSSGGLKAHEPRTYVDNNGVEIVRLIPRKNLLSKLYFKFMKYENLYEEIEVRRPDVLFVHGCQFLDAKTIVKYVENHPDVRLYFDNHCDFSNSADTWFKRIIIHGLVWRRSAQLLSRFAIYAYGVLPARVAFLESVYKVPKAKCKLLVMGADDEEVARVQDDGTRSEIRQRLGFAKDDFIIVTGGKIDYSKRQVFSLIDACLALPKNCKLLVFGPVEASLQAEMQMRVENSGCTYIPWANSSQSYDYFAIADVVVFPGRHSVYWEQVAGMGQPLVVKRWQGTEHIDCGGNVLFLESAEINEIQETLITLVGKPDVLAQMKTIADANSRTAFSYRNIAATMLLDE